MRNGVHARARAHFRERRHVGPERHGHVRKRDAGLCHGNWHFGDWRGRIAVPRERGCLTLGKDDTASAFVLDGAEHVILDGFTVLGSGARGLVALSDTRAVRILNCDLSRWGRTGTPKFDDCGMLHDAKGELVNFDGATTTGGEKADGNGVDSEGLARAALLELQRTGARE